MGSAYVYVLPSSFFVSEIVSHSPNLKRQKAAGDVFILRLGHRNITYMSSIYLYFSVYI